MKNQSLGILAHVDAGKTSLSEALLQAAGVIETAGSVDEGTTQTDSLALERQRGITIRAAVVAFSVADVTVNLIDTPGHPDFIAEVNRSLGVLDGAVLVVSAVEGVQSQTVVLMRALRRLAIPTLIFVNKIDRAGADPERVLNRIRERLTPAVVPMGRFLDAGTRNASFVPFSHDDESFVDGLVNILSDYDDALVEAVVDERPAPVTPAALYANLAAQTGRGQVFPVFFGSAITGSGVDPLMAALPELLPTAPAARDAPASGLVFKVERERNGEKVAYVRMFSGTVHRRQRLSFGDGHEANVTSVRTFQPGGAVEGGSVAAGQIAKLAGLTDVRVGDPIGTDRRPSGADMFAPPTLDTAVAPVDPLQKGALHAALTQLAEQDPFINLRQDDSRQELSLSLYGEVQKEVIEQTLAAEFGLRIEFRETTTICVERPRGRGGALERLGGPGNPFPATVGLTVAPGPVNSGIDFRLAVDLASIPLFVYKTVDAFREAMFRYVADTLTQGLSGWQVLDCVVTMDDCAYTAPGTSASDFRKLTPLVLMDALEQAGTVVCEPIHRFHVEAPAETFSAVLRLLGQHRAIPEAPMMTDAWFSLGGSIPAAEATGVQVLLPGRTHGEGVVEFQFDRYAPVSGPAPTRRRSDNNPLHRKEYLMRVAGRI
ncbi:TetM/TetW/TetO/TetS family tetracycline resistance ribosomal protection protein [Micromonospora sp. KC606]|uniref:elongation factor G n=1 Tax=Micromonospora sp. KC606 TaxID=2530379 RepID=UPI00104C996B|nr:TetM/TetW/TetO/TetS family tetracycline resistance ribosomal protection protein [Micromonospora sp. KC606]TDC85513.1 TetM/TetW/TetO/TetS family tetracycline resistance ribosomal protection protein [Micromonospora sp. KC606]